MKKMLVGTILLALTVVVPAPTMAEVGISIGISLPPPVVFAAPPEVIVLPDAPDVYVIPDVDVDIFFWNGWWWRPWEGRWYRSRYYNRGWVYYRSVPSFYFDVDPGWRGYYRSHDWYGHRWDYARIPNRRLQQNWRTWHNDRYWERRGTWGVQGYRPRAGVQRQELRRQREEQYRQRPEVQRHEQERQRQQRHPQVRKPQGERGGPPRGQQPQRQQREPQNLRPQGPQRQERPQPHGEQRQGESRRQGPQGKPERGDAGQR